MIIIQDTREKVGHHTNIENYCKDHKIALYRQKLDVGDYMLGEEVNGKISPTSHVSIDIKSGGLQELANDLTIDKNKLDRKYKRCLQKDISLIVLVETQDIHSDDDVVKWKNPYNGLSGRPLLDYMHRLGLAYGVMFLFCQKEDSPAILKTYLNYGRQGEQNESQRKEM